MPPTSAETINSAAWRSIPTAATATSAPRISSTTALAGAVCNSEASLFSDPRNVFQAAWAGTAVRTAALSAELSAHGGSLRPQGSVLGSHFLNLRREQLGR